jgi:DNA-directed RNA polymerase omega subunit
MDLISLPPESINKTIDSRYRLVEAVVKRARALHNGVMPKVASRSRKVTTVALEEVVSDAVRILTGEEAVKAREKAKKPYQEMIDEAKQKALLPEELTKFEKELQVYLRDKENVTDENAIKE